MKKIFPLIAFIALIISGNAIASKRKVLFIGNSYTYTNNMPVMLQTMATAMGDTLVFDQSDPGGYTFQMHSTYAPTIAKIFSQQWDIVVLQEQSQMPAFPPAEVDTEVYPYAHILDSMVHANDSCTQTMFLMTWGHSNGDPMNCGTYPAICTYEGMQMRLRESYLQMTQDNHAIVAPVGAAWKTCRDSFPSVWLWSPDSSHPATSGSYLEASVLYSSIFHRRVTGCSYTAGLAAADAGSIQHIADLVTMDSLEQWQQYGHYPYAAIAHTHTTGNTISFSGDVRHTSSVHWSFGDGATDATVNPVHTYTTAGTYTVTLMASTDCFTESRTDTVHVSKPVGTTYTTVDNGVPVYAYAAQAGNIDFALPPGYDWLDVYDMQGKLVAHAAIAHLPVISVSAAPGLYLYRAYSADMSKVYTGKVAR